MNAMPAGVACADRSRPGGIATALPSDSCRNSPTTHAAHRQRAVRGLRAVGGDEVLSTYPRAARRRWPSIRSRGLVVAAQGIHVAALIDRAGRHLAARDRAGKPAEAKVTSRWKWNMARRPTLAGFLRHAHQRRPTSAIVLAPPEIEAQSAAAENRPQLSSGTSTGPRAVRRCCPPWARPAAGRGSPRCRGRPAADRPDAAVHLGPWARRSRRRSTPACLEAGGDPLRQLLQHVRRGAAHRGALRRVRHRLPELHNLLHRRRRVSGGVRAARAVGHGDAQPELARAFAKRNEKILEAKGQPFDARLQRGLARMKDITNGSMTCRCAAGRVGACRRRIRRRAAVVQDRQGDSEGPAVRHGGRLPPETPDQFHRPRQFRRRVVGARLRAHPGVHRSAKARCALVGIIGLRLAREQPRWRRARTSPGTPAPTRDEHLPCPTCCCAASGTGARPTTSDINPDPNSRARAAAHHRLCEGHRLGDFIIEYHKGEPGTGVAAGAHPAVPGVQRQLRSEESCLRRPWRAAGRWRRQPDRLPIVLRATQITSGRRRNGRALD